LWWLDGDYWGAVGVAAGAEEDDEDAAPADDEVEVAGVAAVAAAAGAAAKLASNSAMACGGMRSLHRCSLPDSSVTRGDKRQQTCE